MKKIFSIMVAVITAAIAMPANAQVHDLNIDVTLRNDGSAHIEEVWDISVNTGTEWYLVRSNLGDIQVSGLSVSENGQEFINEGSWDVDRDLCSKAGKCGIVSKYNGCEICWGLGSHGHHVFKASYNMSNVVKSLNDYDMVHMQFVSPGLSAAPQHVRVVLHAVGESFDDTKARIWGFGYEGTSNFVDGDMVFESSEPFVKESSVIVLARFEKGIFNSTSYQEREFDDVLDEAMEGSIWEDEDESPLGPIAGFLVVLSGVFLLGRAMNRRNNMNVLGVKSLKEIGWSRNIPFGGNIVESEYILSKVGAGDVNNRIAAAIILKLIQNGYLTVKKDMKDRVEICFNDSKTGLGPDTVEGKLYAMMKEASGSDNILQDREFSRWSQRHLKTVSNWVDSVSEQGRLGLINDGWMQGGKFTEASQSNARDLIGLKKFLKDFTINDERSVNEVGLWQDYLIYAALFGVAEKVCKELKDINPKKFDEVMPYDYATMHHVIYSTNSLSRSITHARTSYTQKSGAAGGHGGGSSFGGGGGFSGGGFGGGAR